MFTPHCRWWATPCSCFRTQSSWTPSCLPSYPASFNGHSSSSAVGLPSRSSSSAVSGVCCSWIWRIIKSLRIGLLLSNRSLHYLWLSKQLILPVFSIQVHLPRCLLILRRENFLFWFAWQFFRFDVTFVLFSTLLMSYLLRDNSPILNSYYYQMICKLDCWISL